MVGPRTDGYRGGITAPGTPHPFPDDLERFEFEGEESFRLALEVADRADAISRRVKRERPWAASQLGSCGLSVLNNTAEGLGEHSPGDKARFYRYARRSAMETAAMVLFLGRNGLIRPETEFAFRRLLLHVIKRLTRRAIHFQRKSRLHPRS